MRRGSTGLAGLLVVFAVAMLPAVANGATIIPTTTGDEFNGGGDCSLREAIDLANGDMANTRGCTGADDDADIIQLSSGATYQLTLPDSVVGPNSEEGDADGDLDVLNEALTIETSGPGRATIDANGDGVGDPATTNERAIDVPSSTSVPSLTLTNLEITDGSSGFTGGGLQQLGAASLTITSSKFFANKAASASGGGAIWAGTGTQTIDDSVIEQNSAPSTAGIGHTGGTLAITDSTISGNSGPNGVGGILISTGATQTSLTNTTVSGNITAGNGGGIFVSTGVVTLANVTVTKNIADSDGGGAAGDGGGLYRQAGTVNIRNSIIADNTDASMAGNVYPDCIGGIASQGYNLFEDTTGCISAFTNDLVGQDPQLGTLANNGGPTPTHGLLSGSPAINAGNPAIPHDGSGMRCEAADQRGVLRPDSDPCDIGAFEGVLSPAPPPPGPPATPALPAQTVIPALPAAAATKKCKKGRKLKRGRCVKKKKKK